METKNLKERRGRWNRVKLKNCISEIRTGPFGSLLHAEDYIENAIPVINPTNIISGEIVRNTLNTISDEKYESLAQYGVSTNDILIGRRGEMGRCALVKPSHGKMLCGTGCMKVTVDKDRAHPIFLISLLQRPKTKAWLSKNSVGTTMENINPTILGALPLLLPPLPEQRKIAQILGTWDEAIAKTEALIAQLELRKKGLMQQLLTGQKRLPGFSGEWKEVRLGDYFLERKEVGYTDLPLLSVGVDGVYPQSQSDKKDTSNSNKSKYKRIMPDDIGYNTMRMWQGRCALSQLEGIISPAYTVTTPKDNANSLFFSYMFQLPSVIHKFYRNSQGMVSDTWMCKFKDFTIVKLKCPPTIEEQVEIGNLLSTVDTEIKTLQQQADQLQLQKKGLMQQLLTGQKRVKV